MQIGCVVSAMLAGCGAPPPIGSAGATPQMHASSAHVDRSGSRVRPGSSSQDRLYAGAFHGYSIYVFSYPEGEFAYTLQLKELITGTLCSNSSGDVFVPSGNEVIEYAGGSGQIATLSERKDYVAYGCSVDPTTGNLAVANENVKGGRGVIAIFAGAQGNPAYYSDSAMDTYWYCGYDDQGNLFVDGQGDSRFAELPQGSKKFTNISVPVKSFGQIQWDGEYITVATETAERIYRLKVMGSSARVVSITHLTPSRSSTQPWIEGNTIIRAFSHFRARSSEIGLWKYPGGGRHHMVIKVENKRTDVFGVTVTSGN